MVVIYPSRNIESVDIIQFREVLALERVKRIYLDELGEEGNNSLGVGVVKLIIEKSDSVANKARTIVEQVKQELIDEAVISNFIDLIEKIIVYKLPNKSREEIESLSANCS